ncbi:hypothetical protein CDL15_Pgr004010 [Punica granatum]|uniref:Uncharacterized protein n=1 Tax=Punica granatum TaxID=22663 RepID=A0A218XGI9_PUNGR|nr:hypothetical protein CDL15_Pgr004010 [Punica granatum]
MRSSTSTKLADDLVCGDVNRDEPPLPRSGVSNVLPLSLFKIEGERRYWWWRLSAPPPPQKRFLEETKLFGVGVDWPTSHHRPSLPLRSDSI